MILLVDKCDPFWSWLESLIREDGLTLKDKFTPSLDDNRKGMIKWYAGWFVSQRNAISKGKNVVFPEVQPKHKFSASRIHFLYSREFIDWSQFDTRCLASKIQRLLQITFFKIPLIRLRKLLQAASCNDLLIVETESGGITHPLQKQIRKVASSCLTLKGSWKWRLLNSREQAPISSRLNAVDLYLVVCIFFVFSKPWFRMREWHWH